MPIVVAYNPAKMVGDLASNAGQFATGQAVFDQNLHASAQANQYAESQQQHDIEQQRINQDAANVAEQHRQAAAWHAQQAALSEQQLHSTDQYRQGQIGVRQDANQVRQQQVANQGDYQQGQLGVRQDANGIRQQAVDQTGVYQQGNLGIRQQSVDQTGDYQQGILGTAQRKVTAYEQHVADQASGGNQLIAAHIHEAVQQDRDIQQARAYVTTLVAQEDHLTKLASSFDPMVDQATKENAQQQLAVIRNQRAQALQGYQQLIMRKISPSAQQPAAVPALPQAAPAQMAPPIGGPTQMAPAAPEVRINPQTGEKWAYNQQTDQWVRMP